MKILSPFIMLLCVALQAQVGIGTIDPKTQLEVDGALSLREGAPLTLNNGLNTDINLGTTSYSFYRITGPTASFSISGFIPETDADGQILTIVNTTTEELTILNNTGTSSRRIFCPGGNDLVLTGRYSTATFQFNTLQNKWYLISSSSTFGESDDWTTTGNSGTTAGTNFVGTTDDVDLMFKRNSVTSGRIGTSNTSLGVNTLINVTSAGIKNSAFGFESLKTNTGGFSNSAFGRNALNANIGGQENSAFGDGALLINTTGDFNSAFGMNALQNNNAADNSAFGMNALQKNTSGLDNAAFGRSAMEKNTTGLGNAAFGEHAMFNNIGGSSNVAVGENSLEENTSGIGNVVLGEDAGTRNTTGSGNVVIGQEALFSFPLGVSTGDNNVIIGRYAAQSNTSGRLNVIIGKDAMLSSTSSNFNVIMGVGAGSDPDSRADAAAITTGDQNTLIGYKTQVSSSSAENATAIGFRALADCDDCLILGGVSGTNSGTSVNVGIGNNDPSYALDVTGDIRFSGSMRSGGSVIHPDYVFETYFDNNNSFNKAYSFMSLKEVDVFLKNNYHLPGVQSRNDVLENGWIVSENVRTNLEKIEELFLHTIEMDKKVTKLQQDKVSLMELVEIQKEQLEKQNLLINSILKKIEE